jgi:ethanolaminephosphotransferase
MSSKTSRSPSPSKSKEKANSVSMFGYAMDARETKALREYKYQSENRSIICASPVAELWEIIARFLANNVPFVTPNLVTVVGALCSWTAFWCVHIFRDISDKDQWVPLGGDNYIYLGAFLIWSYNTLDNVDGKLARNRKMGSPLGQMMDHGCDYIDRVSCALTRST